MLYCNLLTLDSCLSCLLNGGSPSSSSLPPLLQNHSLPLSQKPNHLAPSSPSSQPILIYNGLTFSAPSKLAPSITARIVGLSEGRLVQISIRTWLLEQHPSTRTHNVQPHATSTTNHNQSCSSNIPQPGRITYSHTPHLQPAITKVMCHMLWTSV